MPANESSPNTAKESRWFVAELVLKITVADDDRNVVHKNLLLVEAKSKQEAYEKAIALGYENETSYDNPTGKTVDIRFQGLSKLMAVHDRLQDGAELLYEEHLNVSNEEMLEWIVPKHLLTVFRDVEPSPGPDYSSAEILGEASRIIRKSK